MTSGSLWMRLPARRRLYVLAETSRKLCLSVKDKRTSAASFKFTKRLITRNNQLTDLLKLHAQLSKFLLKIWLRSCLVPRALRRPRRLWTSRARQQVQAGHLAQVCFKSGLYSLWGCFNCRRLSWGCSKTSASIEGKSMAMIFPWTTARLLLNMSLSCCFYGELMTASWPWHVLLCAGFLRLRLLASRDLSARKFFHGPAPHAAQWMAANKSGLTSSSVTTSAGAGTTKLRTP